MDDLQSNRVARPGPKDWWNFRVAYNLIGIGFAMGLFGYDNAFTSPLVSLPLFVAKYQGPGYMGAYAFTVRSPS
ncbi:hypothetical protein LTR10_018085 [Elasticomyces elasticus]|uniref:Major facilitator superfamily (MFS) profile domain-containing protein n=1 Tax=Exophiala sideris TaxID=1016849 RepID=A0ABR0IWQ0_9EURO|nr:hypothetical protein LTR10_018085 [Elasticomyces elasticus]KAK5021682.1 hypothetical protein LTS07_010724 [Exophiala sideris]KAK5050113.1 hypothetical protein LTR69_010747 [Exophiala sideris]KAK5176861.1 hypothetical protein LTR44_010557 [Eurotiomycetes sp. CCFEE 6388]